MAHIYFIGGTPRTGKTTLAEKFVATRPIGYACADHIRFLLRNLLSPTDYPELFEFIKYVSNDPSLKLELQNNHQKALVMQTAESQLVWKSIQAYIRSSLIDGQDLLIEGLAIMPEFLENLDYEFSAIFLGNQSQEHYQIVEQHAKENSNDWMHNLNPETITMFSELNQSYSQLMETQAMKYGLAYYEMHDFSFETDLMKSLDMLLA
jgi:2-phosphoglycerate kinase